MAAAELKLQVGLDLAFFRQQLAQLGNVAVGYQLPINIKFDRLGIQQELNRLATNINRRKYKLEIATNIKSETEAAQKLDAALSNLQGKEIGIKITGTLGKIAPKDATKIRNDLAEAVAGGTGKKILVDVGVRENAIGEELRAVRKALNEKITPKNGKILVATSIRSGITNEEAKEFRESVKRKIGNIIVDVTGSADQLRVKEAKSIRTSLYQSIISNGGKIKIPATLTIADSEVTAFQKAVNSKFAGITVKVKAEIEEIQGGKTQAQIEKEAMAGWQRIQEVGAARMSGGSSDPARRESLRQSLSGRDIGELRSIGEQLGVKGARRYSNVQNLIEKIVADASIEMIKKYLDPQAVMRNPDRSGLGKVLDTFARGVFHMLGMDPAAMMAAQKQKLLPPSISWPASVSTPPQYQGRPGTMLAGAPAPALIGGAPGPAGLLPAAYRGIGQSAGPAGLLPAAYRGIGGAPVPRGLGGTAFGAQKYLPTALGNETKQVLRDAANAFLDAIRQGIREVKIQDFGNQQRAIAGQRVAGLLSPGIGRTPSAYAMGGETQAELFARRTREAQVKSDLREMDVMGGGAGRTAASYSYAYRAARPTSAIVPYGPGGALVAGGSAPPAPPSPPAPPTPPGGGRGGFGSFGSFRGAMPNVSLPGAGLVKEVGDQFGYAAQQVLLFGTTYKALAFLTDFPSKVGEAVAQLQSFRNTLQAITPNADEFQKSNQFILDTVDKYNIPIQSARDGFTKLYASMQPAGFSGEQIQKLFLGISKASATLGLSSDKVDRVTYAFSQMASKGQLMSEEVTGQLGDVIPGALSIMAKAANMDIKTFKKAMEDGVFVGKAFTDVMSNVPIVLEQRFGKGAEGAAKTFQGQMNAMATATKMLYESFVPVGDLFTSKIVAPFTNGLQVLAEGFNAFFSGAATKTAGGSALFQELEKLRPTFKGIADNIKQLLPVLQSFATTLLGLGKILLQIVSNPFVGYLARVYLAVLPLTMAIQALNLQALIPMIGSLLRAIPAFIAFSTAAWNGASRTVALRIAMQATGQTATIAGGQVALLSNTLKTAFVGTVVGAVVIGIGMIIERIMTLSNKMEEAKGSALRLQDSIKGMSKTELQVEENKLGRQGALLQELQRASGGQKYALLNKQQEEMVMKLAPGSITRVTKAGKGGNKLVEVASGLKAIGGGLAAIDVTMLPAIEQKIQSLRQNIDSARLTLNASDQNTSLNLAPITGAGGDEASAKAAAALYENRSRVADDLSKMQTAADIERETAVFNFRVDRMNAFYDMQEARANSFQKASIQFQREMFNIEVQRQKANLDAQNQIAKAQGSVASGRNATGAYLQGDIGPTSTGPHFDVKKVGGGYFDRKFLDQYVQVNGKPLSSGTTVGGGTFAAHQDRGSSGWDYVFGGGRHAATLMGGAQWLEGKPTAHGEQRRFQIPTGEQFQFLHGKSEGIGAIPPGKIAASQARTMKAELATNIAITKEHETATRADEKALLDQQVAMQKYVSSIMPIAEQELQIQLLQKRSELTKSGISQEQIDTEMQIFETRTKSGIALKNYTRLIEQYENAVKTGDVSQGFANKAIAGFRAEIDKINKGLPLTVQQIRELSVAQSELKMDTAMKDLQKRLDMARALTPEAEMRTRLQQQGYAGAQLETLFETEKTTVKAEELKAKMQGVASTIGDAFSTAFQGIINGSMSAQDALAGMFQSIGQSFVKMATEMIAQQVTMITLGFIMKALGLIGGIASAGNAAGAAAFSPSNAAGFDAIPGQAFSLPQLSGTMIDGSGFGAAAFAGPLAGGFAKGGAFSSGMRRFATGGIVNGPTLFPFADGGAMQMGLMGEAGPEAIMPLQRGADGSLGVRAAMGGNGMGGSSSPILNMSFETSTINGVEYVSRDQLEAAMMQTRRQASSDGAKRGMAMTLDKIQQSPQTRRRIGM